MERDRKRERERNRNRDKEREREREREIMYVGENVQKLGMQCSAKEISFRKKNSQVLFSPFFTC